MAKKLQSQFQTSKHAQVFSLVKDNGKIKICVANYLVSPKEFDTFEQANEYIGRKPYDLIFATILLLVKLQKEHETINPEIEKDPKGSN